MAGKGTAVLDAADNYKGVYGHRIGFGRKAAVLIVDFVQAYTVTDSPLYAAGVVDAVRHSADVLKAARAVGMPIVHTTITYQSNSLSDAGAWFKKSPVLKTFVTPPLNLVCEGLEPSADEIVIHKQYASAFFGTSLASTLVASGIDTIIVMGCSTSGCVRATAVDGVQHGFHVMVVRECVGDRHPDPHESNLFDIDSKYGDVITKAEALAHIGGLRQGHR